MTRTRDEIMLAALTTRINALKGEYAEICAEIDAVGDYLDALVRLATETHNNIIDMRCVAFKVLARVREQQPESARAAA